MERMLRWLVEIWLLRMLFRLVWRVAVIGALIVGLAAWTGHGGDLKGWFFHFADRVVGGDGKTQASLTEAESLQQPAVELLKANWQEDQQSMHQAEQALQPVLQRAQQQHIDPAAANRWITGSRKDEADQFNQQLESANGEEGESGEQ